MLPYPRLGATITWAMLRVLATRRSFRYCATIVLCSGQEVKRRRSMTPSGPLRAARALRGAWPPHPAVLVAALELPGQRSRPNANPANDEERSVPTMALEVMMQVLRKLTGRFIISMAFG